MFSFVKLLINLLLINELVLVEFRDIKVHID